MSTTRVCLLVSLSLTHSLGVSCGDSARKSAALQKLRKEKKDVNYRTRLDAGAPLLLCAAHT